VYQGRKIAGLGHAKFYRVLRFARNILNTRIEKPQCVRCDNPFPTPGFSCIPAQPCLLLRCTPWQCRGCACSCSCCCCCIHCAPYYPTSWINVQEVLPDAGSTSCKDMLAVLTLHLVMVRAVLAQWSWHNPASFALSSAFWNIPYVHDQFVKFSKFIILLFWFRSFGLK